MNRNPNGKGGFADNPENINAGGRPKNAESFAYWFMTFKNMTLTELAKWNKETPDDKRTVAADLAYRRVFNSQKDLKEFQEVADRSEGRPKQSIEQNININPVDKILEGFGLAGQTEDTKETTSQDNS